MSASEIVAAAKSSGVLEDPEALVAFALGFKAATSPAEASSTKKAPPLLPSPPKLAQTYSEHHAGTVLLPSHVESALTEHEQEAAEMIRLLKTKPKPLVHNYKPEIQGCVFTGHTNTDMDSIGTAIACADLYGGIAARSSEINGETKFVMKRWGLEVPKAFEDKEIQSAVATAGVCLVDHNQTNQSPASLDCNTVRGIIDHHALQSNIATTNAAIFFDLRPWGSCCSIITHHYLSQNKPIPPKVAGVLLSGILSDTLNLQSPTTTVHDRKMLTVLAHTLGLGDREGINKLANEQFSAKSAALGDMTVYETYHGDAKNFGVTGKGGKTYKVYWGTCEFFGKTWLDFLLKKKSDIQYEMRAFKKEKGLDYIFFSMVDIQNLHTLVLVADSASMALANYAFTGKKTWDYKGEKFVYDSKPIDRLEEGTIDLGSYVSRKKTFVPPVSGSIGNKMWAAPAELCKPDPHHYAPVIHSCGMAGCRPKRLRLVNIGRMVLNARKLGMAMSICPKIPKASN